MAANHISEFMRYLAAHPEAEQGLPPLAVLSEELGVSVASLREQLEVARALGLVEVRPRTGIRRRPYEFLPAVRQSLGYAMALDESNFQRFADLRRHVEAAYWHEAAARLTAEDREKLRQLVARAWEKLDGRPIQIPHEEHKQLHLTIFGRLENPFVSGILEAYWEAYESIGLNVFTDYAYLREVWGYHQRMVDAIASGDLEGGYRALVEHADMLADLLDHRPGGGKQ
ncbi:MAG: FCD domain-containing protein [Anaerolineales bacterium]|nr:FCD domain-containing protein [Anaerolineales bacterium]MCX7755715.1 FCD domain-containing protein [Anaerolineales bacterium]MDW8277684.1 FCD domain-containing protein [Anaerolineales bacterium]